VEKHNTLYRMLLQRGSIAALVLLCIASLMLTHPDKAHASGNNYYVATNGSNNNPGTLSQPFATIQKCASIAVAGDTCYIRGGTYRETVTPTNSGTGSSPVTFTSYNGESVTVSGLDRVGGWTNYSGSIYRTSSMNWDLGLGNNQIFVDGRMVNEAMWPNMSATADPSHPTLATISSGSFTGSGTSAVGTLNDSNIPNGLTGAQINAALAGGYLMQTGTITSSTYGSATFTYNRFDTYVQPDAGDVYIVWGKLSLLDTANETFYDSSTKKLYLWTPNSDNPSNHTIEAKHRQHAFNLNGRSAITIENLSIIGADVITDSNSTGNILNNIQGSYLTHALNITGSPWSFRQGDSGIVFNGSNNTLTNSTIAYSSANGVTLNGSNHTVSNNFIHDTDYAGTDSATITTGYIGSSGASTGHLIQYNTLYNSARSILLHRNSGNLRILYNDMFSAGLQVKDLGITYTYDTDGQGTVIAYNLVHDNYSSGYRSGIYLDNGSHNFIVHHNVVWNSGHALTLNTPSLNNKVYNNTLVGQDSSVRASPAGGDMTGTELKNNIFTSILDGVSSSVVQQNNLYQGTDPLFTNPGNNDYTLQSGSPAIDAGQVISPYTDGYVGSAPDEGAYEYGAPQWYAGA